MRLPRLEYSLKGDLTSAAFRNGLRGEGGLPKDFELADHGLQKLCVATFCGLAFATPSILKHPHTKTGSATSPTASAASCAGR